MSRGNNHTASRLAPQAETVHAQDAWSAHHARFPIHSGLLRPPAQTSISAKRGTAVSQRRVNIAEMRDALLKRINKRRDC